ncbi:MAG: hypothetical protein RLZ77_1746, partial [Bacteroidota bacterium]
MRNKVLLIAIGLALTTHMIKAQVPSYVPTNGLVGYWPFNGNANDESGNAHNGTNNGATLTSDRFGNANSAYNFDGFNDFIQLQIPSLDNSISIGFWAYDEGGYPNTYSINPRYVSSEFCNGGFALVNNVNNSPNGIFFSRNRGTSSADIFSNVLPSYLVNQHIVFTYNGTVGKFYINGNLVSSISNSGNITTSANLYFGKSGCSPSPQMADAFKGKIDDIGIWNRALTQEEIVGLFNAQSNTCETLVINSGPLSFNPPTYASTVTIYPNPANDQITIDCGNLANVSGWSIKIVNAIGQEVFTGEMNTQQYVVPLNSWSGQGLY